MVFPPVFVEIMGWKIFLLLLGWKNTMVGCIDHTYGGGKCILMGPCYYNY
jgi:hypothetical protein